MRKLDIRVIIQHKVNKIQNLKFKIKIKSTNLEFILRIKILSQWQYYIVFTMNVRTFSVTRHLLLVFRVCVCISMSEFTHRDFNCIKTKQKGQRRETIIAFIGIILNSMFH